MCVSYLDSLIIDFGMQYFFFFVHKINNVHLFTHLYLSLLANHHVPLPAPPPPPFYFQLLALSLTLSLSLSLSLLSESISLPLSLPLPSPLTLSSLFLSPLLSLCVYLCLYLSLYLCISLPPLFSAPPPPIHQSTMRSCLTFLTRKILTEVCVTDDRGVHRLNHHIRFVFSPHNHHYID